ncbi:MAG: threonylcarbamoyl-AMP synthase [Burkholderiales bacterium]|nr:threonylcarbamoyl-AMP synthase [Burkholderiales bacterium]
MILDGRDPASVRAAAQALRGGELVGLPTETVYGLGADAVTDTAVAKIFAAKGRPSDHPLIVHVADASGVDHFAREVPAFAHKLMQVYWPGPLTLILPRRPEVGAAAAGGQDSIGLRCPAHPVAHALLLAAREQGVHGVAAPSANQFGRVSPTTAAHVQGEFGESLLILDGGPCDVGIESTIIDCTRGAPVLLRPGHITREQIEASSGQRLRDKDELAAPSPRASGTLEAHYAPKAKLRLMDGKALQTALDVLGKDFNGATIAVYARSLLRVPSPKVSYRRMPDDAAATAQQLFAVLRDFDAQGVNLIWVETPPGSSDWEGVRDRLQRAAAS